MTRLWLLWDSSVGKKVIMAVTGLVMVAYLITHVVANLLVFQGPTRINAYSAFLHGTGGAPWVGRPDLLASLLLHGVAAGAPPPPPAGSQTRPYWHRRGALGGAPEPARLAHSARCSGGAARSPPG